MLSAVAALTLTPIAYGFAPGSTNTFYVRVGLNGFLPLLGGRDGQAQVDLAVAVKGLSPDASNLQATSDLTDFHVKFNGAEFPVDLDTAKGYFPKNTVAFTPQGHVEKNDAGDEALPVRLPGLDKKRIPDITYLPIEFPADGIEEGKSWSFKKTFDGADLNYTITPTSVKDDVVQLKIDLTEHDEYFTDDSNGVVPSQDKAADKVVSDLTGSGTATFDRKLNLVSAVSIKMENLSKETDLKTKEVTPHSLTTTLAISLNKPLALSVSTEGTGALDLLRNKIEQSRPVQTALVASQLVHPTGGKWRSPEPLIRSTVDRINVISQRAVGRQIQNLSVLSRDAASRVPELFNVENVHAVGGFLSSVPSIVGAHWGPYYERANGLANQFIQYISPDDASPSQAARIIRNQNQYKSCLPTRQIKSRG